MFLLFSIKILLAWENKLRDAEPRDESFEDVYVVKIDKNGNRTEVKVSKVRVPLNWNVVSQVHVNIQAGVLGFDRSTKSRLQICLVVFVVSVLCKFLSSA